ncbi:MAG: SUMF1/EgtB/PvdO family nonheme iron enzyme [Verrucomicrobia bacterium]|nr:SUMF1/EgtB/PvdO family nonheme iron enzyme [Verrucomicrobiota bacterium]
MIPLSRLLSRRSFFPVLLALLPALAGPLAAGILSGQVINPGTGHSYYLLTQNTWSASEAEAVTLGGHLVTISDSAENEWVHNTFSRFGGSAKTLWIGLHDSATEGTFAWTSGQSAEFRNWAAGEPSAGSAGEDYVHLYELDRGATSAGQWNVHTDQTTESGVPLHGVVGLPPVVANVRAAQRAGTNLVDIDYDVTGTTKPVQVTLEVSGDNGTTFAVPATSVTGAVGRDITPAANLRLTWDVGADWAGHTAAQARFRISADDNPVPPGFALIPAGPFQMGDQSSPLVGYPFELPVHTVQVSAFYMGKCEVTKEEWDAVRTWGLANGYTDLPAGNGGYASKGANHPVHSITWYDMVKWCNARSQKEGLTLCYTVSGATYKTGQSAPVCNWSANGYRLPTEAEWEKAARGGVAGKNFPWGTDTITHSQANYESSPSYAYDVSPTRGYHPTYNTGDAPHTSPVGSFAPNGYGLYDMAGNVWEWCWDWYGSYTSGSQTDPRGATSGSYRVIRGGGWAGITIGCRAAYRNNGYPPDYSNYRMGFRPARSSDHRRRMAPP